MSRKPFRIAIVGRPNVGKSTLFNTLSKTRKALVERSPGVTRDRVYAQAEIADRKVTLIDTGGLLPGDEDQFAREIFAQAKKALKEADLILFVVDGQAGITPVDEELASFLHKLEKPVIVLVNKLDGPRLDQVLSDFYALGFDEVVGISAKHKRNLDELEEVMAKYLPEETEEEDLEEEIVKLAVLGRPNVGKSSLVNRLLGEERMIVSDVPGTTRDSVDTLLELPDGRKYLLIDTAGIRRRPRIKERVEKFSVDKALEALRRADIALMVLTAEEGITDQDQKILSQIDKNHKGCLIVVNKWDLLDGKREEANVLMQQIRYGARFVPWAPILTVSAKTGRRVKEILPIVDEIYKQYSTRVPTWTVNKALEEITQDHSIYASTGKRIKFYYGTQVETRPPTFVVFTNYPDEIPKSFERYLKNRLREKLGFDKSPVKVIFREKR
ncbi:ribosome-associated GTPase EngA [Thermodesulfatator indicus DSM 15286]|uniref:GTPase Der n=1 Tax=Thermodesulfatator indicus (strain DSM 15286 / JCM 11887 / CIR29812) TaxID=667014 RepID=F8ACQ9_THEID|nr:ribosome biogenesis GTPase Der [Thermodesulfatator indicus]AEH45840.1 ribosome-associated GTPase EngA [Thermodesulfatator indicus DSM 15286]